MPLRTLVLHRNSVRRRILGLHRPLAAAVPSVAVVLTLGAAALTLVAVEVATVAAATDTDNNHKPTGPKPRALYEQDRHASALVYVLSRCCFSS